MPRLEKKGFLRSENDFTQCSEVELLRHFHQYGFKDDVSRDLVSSEDFVALINQFCGLAIKAREADAGKMIGDCVWGVDVRVFSPVSDH